MRYTCNKAFFFFFFFFLNYELHENEQKEVEQDVEAAIGEFIEELKTGVNYMNRDSILEDLVYSEKTSKELYYLMRKEYSEMSFWELKSE